MGLNRVSAQDRVCRLIGDSQLSYWFLAVECFLKKFLVSEFRQHPAEALEANLWLIKYVEELPHRGSKRAEPRPAMCTLYQASAHMATAEMAVQSISCTVWPTEELHEAPSYRCSCAHVLLLSCFETPGAEPRGAAKSPVNLTGLHCAAAGQH